MTLLNTAKEAIKVGYRTIVLQCGEDPKLDKTLVAKIVSEIRQLGAAILSCGEWDESAYKLWREAGAIATHSNKKVPIRHFSLILDQTVPKGKRLSHHQVLRQLGYQVGGVAAWLVYLIKLMKLWQMTCVSCVIVN